MALGTQYKVKKCRAAPQGPAFYNGHNRNFADRLLSKNYRQDAAPALPDDVRSGAYESRRTHLPK